MTITAGFIAHDGILLCSDSQYTSSERTDDQKIFARFFEGAAVVFALSGDTAYGRTAIEDCREAISSFPSEQRTIPNIRKTVRRVMKRILADYDARRLEPSERPQFLVAITTREEETRLFSTRETAMSPVTRYECQGSGSYLGNYIIGPIYQEGMSVSEAAVIAMSALSAAKKHDTYCGGFSQFVAIARGRLTAVLPFDPQATECLIERYEGYARLLLLDTCNGEILDSDFPDRLAKFTDRVLEIRRLVKEAGAANQELLATLSRPLSSPTSSSTDQT